MPGRLLVGAGALVVVACGGGASNPSTQPVTPTPPTTLTLTSVSAGSTNACGVTTSGAAYCWGNNVSGQLGDGTTTDSYAPVLVAGGHTFVAVSAGIGDYGCGLTTSGAAYCWGRNKNGRFGDGTTTASTRPVAVAGGLAFANLSAGDDHTCGVTTGGAAWCWGNNIAGQLGNGSTTESRTPVAVAGGLKFAAVSTGVFHTCGVTTGGAVYCWGDNTYGQHGNGTTASSSVPVLMPTALTYAAVSAGNGLGAYTCALSSGGEAYCWGYNGFGERGDGTTTASLVPVPVAGGLTLASLSAGGSHTCGVTAGGVAYCWGYNDDGQLGNGLETDSYVPVAVSGGLTFRMVSSGNGSSDYTCGVTTGGAAYCWGFNEFGELGNGTTTESVLPVAVLAPRP